MGETSTIGIVSEFIEGPGSLGHAIAGADPQLMALSIAQRTALAIDIAQGLANIHTGGVIHRDLKPENVMLKTLPADDSDAIATGVPLRAYIIDFGVSFLLQTASGTAAKANGTVGYDAPEVAEGETPTARSDIYSLSYVLYELFVGRRIFTGMKEVQIIRRFTIGGERPDLSLLRRTGVSEGVCQVLQRGWDADPHRRPQVAEFLYVLRGQSVADVLAEFLRVPAARIPLEERAFAERSLSSFLW
jgi:serine/threonine protein kinase